MSDSHSKLITPLFIKAQADTPWPVDEPTFHMLTGNGLFLCRNHDWFRSCVPAPQWPSELAGQKSFLVPAYPTIPKAELERTVGFFAAIAERHGAEAGAYLVWDSEADLVSVHVPDQEATMCNGWGGAPYATGLQYDRPPELAAGQVLLGTVHSHVYGPAYASGVDVHDEVHKPGVHLVVGRLHDEPPDLHVEAVVDGSRFRMAADTVLEGYDARRNDFPEEWIGRVRVVTTSGWSSSSYGNGGPPDSGYGYGPDHGGEYGSGGGYGSGAAR